MQHVTGKKGPAVYGLKLLSRAYLLKGCKFRASGIVFKTSRDAYFCVEFLEAAIRKSFHNDLRPSFWTLRAQHVRTSFGTIRVRSYKRLAEGERAFRSLKTVDLHIRPIFHHKAERVRAHVFLCMLAYYVERHLHERLKPLLFDEEDEPSAEPSRASVVAPARRSARTLAKVHSKRTAEGLPVHSFRTLLQHLATLTLKSNRAEGSERPALRTCSPLPPQSSNAPSTCSRSRLACKQSRLM